MLPFGLRQGCSPSQLIGLRRMDGSGQPVARPKRLFNERSGLQKRIDAGPSTTVTVGAQSWVYQYCVSSTLTCESRPTSRVPRTGPNPSIQRLSDALALHSLRHLSEPSRRQCPAQYKYYPPSEKSASDPVSWQMTKHIFLVRPRICQSTTLPSRVPRRHSPTTKPIRQLARPRTLRWESLATFGCATPMFPLQRPSPAAPETSLSFTCIKCEILSPQGQNGLLPYIQYAPSFFPLGMLRSSSV